MKKLLTRLFGKGFFGKPLFQQPEDQEFVSLMQIALEDDVIRQQLMKILSLPDQIRRATVQQWRTELEQQQAPEPIIKTLSYLEYDGAARRAREILKGNEQ